jgi:hypothetical protein
LEEIRRVLLLDALDCDLDDDKDAVDKGEVGMDRDDGDEALPGVVLARPSLAVDMALDKNRKETEDNILVVVERTEHVGHAGCDDAQ